MIPTRENFPYFVVYKHNHQTDMVRHYLTLGKVYKVELVGFTQGEGFTRYWIKNDIGNIVDVPEMLFYSLGEWREIQLNELGI